MGDIAIRKSFILVGAVVSSAQQANAAELVRGNVKPLLEDEERIHDGLAIAPVYLDTSLAGFDLELVTSVVRESRPRPAATAATTPQSVYDYSAVPRAARLTDIQLSARKTVPITKKLAVDILLRAEVPTGSVRAGLGRGRMELMADVGIRAELKPVSLWAGVARRFSKKTYWSYGRDVNEVYGGWNARVSKSEDLRMDFVYTQKRRATAVPEWRISGEYSKSMGSGRSFSLYAGQDKGSWGRDRNAGITLRFRY